MLEADAMYMITSKGIEGERNSICCYYNTAHLSYHTKYIRNRDPISNQECKCEQAYSCILIDNNYRSFS
jgi:hypothetical protein